MNARNEKEQTNYQPTEKPLLIRKAEEQSKKIAYQTYQDIRFYIKTTELPETLKVVGLPRVNDWSFQNIDEYHNTYKEKVRNSTKPYQEVGMVTNARTGAEEEYIFGCIVNSLEVVPEGLFGFDTGFKKFAVMTFRTTNAESLVESEPNGMMQAMEYLASEWIPQNKEIVVAWSENFHYQKRYNDIESQTSLFFEVYPCDIQNEPEMCLYVPLK